MMSYFHWVSATGQPSDSERQQPHETTNDNAQAEERRDSLMNVV